MRTKQDITGNTYGKLTVVDHGKEIRVLCRCECGKMVSVNRYNLLNGNTVSCGCYRSENMRKMAPKNCMKRMENYGGSGTNIGYLLKRGISKANKTGHTGVFYNEKRDTYYARIGFRNKLYYLGSFKNLEDAVRARKKAEEMYFDPVIADYKHKQAEKHKF